MAAEKRQLIVKLLNITMKNEYTVHSFLKHISVFSIHLIFFFYCASNSNAISSKISCQDAQQNAELICTDILTSISGENV